MGSVVLHINKVSGNDAAMTAHIERTIDPANADQERTHLNKELIEFPDGVANRTAAIQHRLDNAGLTRKIGTNQIRALRFMLSGTPEDMQRIRTEGRLDEWCEDSVKWVQDTFGKANLVSAVLHLDETTPHIHATVVPIVTGERRKAQAKPAEPGKKTYRKKNPNAARLCSDDIMTREKMEDYQTTYAVAMAKYGLERGVRNSTARHITTQQYYKDLYIKSEEIKGDILELQQVEESKRQVVSELERQEEQARTRTEQATIEKQQAETELTGKQSELQQVKGELKTEKFKSTAADAGSAIMDGISSALGTSKVKRQQQEIESLKSENQSQQQKIVKLNQTINRQRQESEKTAGELKGKIDKIYLWFPDTPQLLKMGDYCKSVGFPDDMVRELVNMHPVGFSGKLFSHEFSRKFETPGSVAQLERDAKSPGIFNLLIDKIHIIDWFRQKRKELFERMGIKTLDPKQHIGPRIK